jgi:hypothetical protein
MNKIIWNLKYYSHRAKVFLYLTTTKPEFCCCCCGATALGEIQGGENNIKKKFLNKKELQNFFDYF